MEKWFARSPSLSSASWSSGTRGAEKDQVIKEGIHEVRTKSKACTKESTSRKPQEIKLHTQQRLYFIEQQKKQQERIRKMVKEEEIRLLRKEMVPRTQLMPFFDRPFFPQRSNRPLTIPRDPTFGFITRKCSTSIVPGINSTNRFLVKEEETRLLRKEMVPRAQLMLFFDRPFFPQRSNRPLTIPREPTFGLITRKCSTRKHCSWG
ncbi:hypothetical protein UlMin_045685 [Ulmus minor]